MRTADIISMGVRNLFKRKARTILTIMGVLIGTCAIIVMMSLGVGMNEANLAAVEQIGSVDIIRVSSYYYPPPDADGREQAPQQGTLDDKAIAQLSAFPEVEAATPFMYANYNMVSGKYKSYGANIIGIDASVMDKFDFKVQEGRLLEEGDQGFAVFGFRVPYNFYNTRASQQNYWGWGAQDFSVPPEVDVFNDKIVWTTDWSYGDRKQPGNDEAPTQKPLLHKVQACGVLEGNENIWSEYDYSIIADIKWLQKMQADDSRRNRQGGGGGGGMSIMSYSSGGAVYAVDGGRQSSTYDQALVKVRDRRDVEAVTEMINGMGLGASSPLETLRYLEQTTNQIQQLLGAIAAVSLLVAAIGIANTMVMSVYERTKEIAVMKVLGCKLGDIGMLFLFEAGLIGFFGGVIGVGLSELAAYLLNRFGGGLMNSFGGRGWNLGVEMPPIAIVPLWLVGLGLAFATLIGVVSGFLPARRAMRLSVLQALHNE